MTGCDWHDVGMDRSTLNTDDIEAVGRVVTELRTALGWSKEEAARRAGISSITWKRVEDGLRVQDTKLAAVLRALEIQKIELGGRPIGPTEDGSIGVVADDGATPGRGGGLRRRVAAFGAVLALVPDERQDEALKAAIQPVLGFIEDHDDESERGDSGLSVVVDIPEVAVAADEREQSIAGEQVESVEP